MKVVILAGGYGTRISDENTKIPKPLIEIDNHPILWHIMKLYSFYGFNDFIICLGYKGYLIKDYFYNYMFHNSDMTLYLQENKVELHQKNIEPWKITLVDTGLNTMTGGRLKKIESYIGNETFMMTYGDGLSNVNIGDLLNYHKSHGKIATLTSVQPKGRFGVININNGQVNSFREKLQSDMEFINAGYMVFNSDIFNYIENETTILEKEPLEMLSNEGQLMAYEHLDFWQCMDTPFDKKYLENMVNNNYTPWEIWKKK